MLDRNPVVDEEQQGVVDYEQSNQIIAIQSPIEFFVDLLVDASDFLV